MTSPLRSGLRVLRAAGVALVVVALAGGAHVAGHGELPHPALLVAMVAGVALVSSLVTRRRLGPAALTAVLGASQLGLHQGLSLLSSTSAHARLDCSGTSHGGHASIVSDCAGTALAAGAQAGSHGEEPALMVVAHMVATLLAALVLASAERALWALVGWLRPLVSPPPPVLPPVRRAVPAPGRRVPVPHQPPLLPGLLRRGPPGALAVV